MNGREDEFARDLYNLSQKPIFDAVAFEDFIDKVRSCVAEVTVFPFHLLIILLMSVVFLWAVQCPVVKQCFFSQLVNFSLSLVD